MAHEIRKGVRLAVLLPHEDERDVRRQQQQRGGEPELVGRDHGRQAVANGAIADLIVVLNRDDEFFARESFRLSAMPSPAMWRI